MPDCWFEALGRLLDSSGQERRLTLANAAHTRLAAYKFEVERLGEGRGT